MDTRPYYKAYDDRYRQVHDRNLQWFDEAPSRIVFETAEQYHITTDQKILEIGCGEGRDAIALLRSGYPVLATDVSPEAIRYCRERFPEYRNAFRILDCITDQVDDAFDFIYAVAVVHMLVPDSDRAAFYRFIRDHLAPGGISLICTMGDGRVERQSDICTAFDLQDRIHEPTGTPVAIAGTSCRMVSFETFQMELEQNDLKILSHGITAVEPDFPQMMYAVATAK